MILLRALALLLALVGVAEAAEEAICANTAVLFCDNFEDRAVGADLTTNKGGKTTGWAVSSTTTLLVSTDIAFDGTKALKFVMPACSWVDNSFNGCGSGFMEAIPTFNLSNLYVRHYVRWPAGYVWSPIADKHMALLNNGGAHRAPWAFHTTGGFPSPKHLYEPTATNYSQNAGGGSVTWTTDQWYCIELRVAQTGDVIESWIDNIQRWNYATADLGSTNWTTLMFSGFWNTSPTPGSRGAQARYIDNIVLATQRIGCLGAPATPSAPSNLQVTTP